MKIELLWILEVIVSNLTELACWRNSLGLLPLKALVGRGGWSNLSTNRTFRGKNRSKAYRITFNKWSISTCVPQVTLFNLGFIDVWDEFGDSLGHGVQELDVGLTCKITNIREAKLSINGDYYLLAQEPHLTVAVAQRLLHLQKDWIEGVELFNLRYLLSIQVRSLQFIGDIEEHLQPLDQLPVRFEGLNVEIRLLLDQKQTRLHEILVFVPC